MIARENVKKLGLGYRAMAAIVALCAIAAIASILVFGTSERVTLGALAISAMPVLLLVICLPIALTGYPPKYLLWTMGPESDRHNK